MTTKFDYRCNDNLRFARAAGLFESSWRYATFLKDRDHIAWMNHPYEIRWTVETKMVSYYMDMIE